MLKRSELSTENHIGEETEGKRNQSWSKIRLACCATNHTVQAIVRFILFQAQIAFIISDRVLFEAYPSFPYIPVP